MKPLAVFGVLFLFMLLMLFGFSASRKVKRGDRKVRFAYTYGEGKVLCWVHREGAPDHVVRVGVEKPLAPQSFEASGQERVVGKPAECPNPPRTAYVVLDRDQKYKVRILKDGGGEVASLEGEGLPSSLSFSPTGKQLALVVFGSRRAYSFGGTVATDARVAVLDVDGGSSRFVGEAYDAINDAVFLDPSTVLYLAKPRGSRAFGVFEARYRGGNWTTLRLKSTMEPTMLIPSSEVDFWLNVNMGDGPNGYEYGFQRCHIESGTVKPNGEPIKLGYVWTASYDTRNSTLLVGLDPGRVGAVTKIEAVDVRSGEHRDLKVLYDSLFGRDR